MLCLCVSISVSLGLISSICLSLSLSLSLSLFFCVSVSLSSGSLALSLSLSLCSVWELGVVGAVHAGFRTSKSEDNAELDLQFGLRLAHYSHLLLTLIATLTEILSQP